MQLPTTFKRAFPSVVSLLFFRKTSSSLSESSCLIRLVVLASFTGERTLLPLDFRRGLVTFDWGMVLLLFCFLRFFFLTFSRVTTVPTSVSLSSPASDIPSMLESSDSLVTFSRELCCILQELLLGASFSLSLDP